MAWGTKKEPTVDDIRVAAETVSVVGLALLVGVLFPELGVVADTLSHTSVRLLVSRHVLLGGSISVQSLCKSTKKKELTGREKDEQQRKGERKMVERTCRPTFKRVVNQKSGHVLR